MQRCAEGFNSGVKGLMHKCISYHKQKMFYSIRTFSLYVTYIETVGICYTGCFKKSFTNSIVIVIEFVKLFLKHPVLIKRMM
jgi:hypothetical protein